MRIIRHLMLFTGALALAACSDDDGGASITDIPPLAYTRFVAAVPNTGPTDWRFTNILEFSPPAFGLEYRQFTPYQGTRPGDLDLRIFPTSQDIDVTSQRLVDTTITVQAGRYYTIVHTGLVGGAGADANRVIVYEDNFPATIGTDQYAIRAMHHGPDWGDIDIYSGSSTSTLPSGTPLFANVSYTEVTDYTLRALGATALRALPAGQLTPLMTLANATAPAGAAGNEEDNLTPIGGTGIGGSAILAIFTPGSVVDSDAPQGTAFVSRTTDSTLYATATGYARAQGSFISDNFFIGQTVQVDSFANAANNGTAVITALTDNPRTGSLSLEATAAGYVRTTGSFVTNGFTAGMQVYVTGFDSTANNGFKTVAAVTATTLTVVEPLVAEAAASGRSICQNPCSVMTVTKTGGTAAEGPSSGNMIRGPRPAWVYIIDRHPR